MRNLMLLSVLTLVLSATTLSAHSECFGESADRYGCGIAAPREASLEQFANPSSPVLPYYGPQQGSPYDNLFSQGERRQMLRSIILGNRSNSGAANMAFRSAMNSSARPLRRGLGSSIRVFGSSRGGYGGGY